MSIGTYEQTDERADEAAPAESFPWDRQGAEAAHDAAVDTAPEGDDDTDEDADDETGSGSAKARPAARPSRAQYRRVAVKALDVAAADQTVRAAAASVLGAPEDPADLAAHIMTAPRLATNPLKDIEQLATEIADDPLEAGITPASWEPARQRGVWGVLRVLGAVDTDQPPASQPKAARPILKAVAGLDEGQRTSIASAAELLRRS